jgi:predicted nucleic acid-binding protein
LSELVFVDTSIWVEALRRRPEATAVELSALLDEDRVALAAPVRVEILSGASRQSFRRLHEDLLALPTFYPGRSAWALLEGWVKAAVEKGERFGVGDLLIAAIASEEGGRLWSRDDDFARMSRMGVVQLFVPAPRMA